MALTRGACTGQPRVVVLERRLVLARRPVTSVRALEGEGEAVWPPPPDELLRGAFPQDWRVFRARLVRQEQDERWGTLLQGPDPTRSADEGGAQPCDPAAAQDPPSMQQQQQQQQQRPRRSTTPSRKGSRGGQPWASHTRHRPLWGQQPHHRQQQQQQQQQQPPPSGGDVSGLQKPPARRDPSVANSGAAKRPSPPRLPFPSAVPSLNLAGSSDGALGAAPLGGASASTAGETATQGSGSSSCCGSPATGAGGAARAASTLQSLRGSSSSSSSLADPGELLGGDAGAVHWAHALAAPEVGCVLVAREDVDPNTLGLFNRAVVLITSHDPVYGTVGLILNKPSPLTVGELSTASAVEGFQQVFGEQRLHLGGPVHLDHITLLHPFMGLKGSVRVAEGLYTGGLPDAVLMVQAGLAHASQFVLSLGMSGWAPKQLERELEAGCWHCVAAAPELLLPKLTARRAAGARPPTGSTTGGSSSSSPADVTDAPTPRVQRPSPTPKTSRKERHHAPAQPRRGVPPLQPPPLHPVQATNESCLWWQLLQVAHLT